METTNEQVAPAVWVVFVIIIAICSIILWRFRGSDVSSFEECAREGFPVMESYPRQCRANGRRFVESIAIP